MPITGYATVVGPCTYPSCNVDRKKQPCQHQNTEHALRRERKIEVKLFSAELQEATCGQPLNVVKVGGDKNMSLFIV